MEDDKSVGGYIRVSTQEQSRNGLSLETQEAEIRQYCSQRGWRLHRLYIDRGISARKNLYKREAFMDMMRDVQSHEINHIVILRLDRFFRNVYDYHRMMNEYLTPNGCEWSAIKEEYTTTTTNGRLMINLRLAISEQECDQDSDRIKDVFDRRAKDGYFIGGGMTFGIRAGDDKRLYPSDDAHIVKDIFDTFLRTNSAHATMIEINARHGTDLSYWSINHALKRRIYIGEYRGIPGFLDPIVSEDEFDAAQRILKINTRVRSNRRVYPFSGLLVCSHCGERLVGVTSDGDYDLRYYRCQNAYRNHRCDMRHSISQKKIERYLLNNIDDLLSNYIIECSVKEKSAPAVVSNREQIENKIDRLKDLYINEIIDIDELRKRRAELEAQIVEPSPQEPKDLSSVEEFLNSGFRNIYYDLTDTEKQTLWRSVINKMVISEYDIESVEFI